MPQIPAEEKKYLEHRDFEIIKLFSKGASIESLCSSYDLSEEEINQIVQKSIKVVKKRHIDFRSEPIGKMESLLRKIRNLCSQSKNSKQVSDILGISHKDIKDIIKELDIRVYVPCKDCGALTDRTKRCHRRYCERCARQRDIDSSTRWNRKKYRNNPQHREKIQKKSLNTYHELKNKALKPT